MVFDIQRMSIHDGPGIRTTVFLKGCPLRCVWCHNPESHDRRFLLSFTRTLCIGCGKCFQLCPAGAHTMEQGEHQIRRDVCRRCFLCAHNCCSKALEITGSRMTVSAVLAEVVKDKLFYETSGGGMTLSGGEPLAQRKFTKNLLSRAKSEGLHVCVETSGYAPTACFREIVPLVDLFLFDIKETDPERHRQFTGRSNALIRRNLAVLDSLGSPTVLRCPIIPGFNLRDDHVKALAELSNTLRHCRGIHVLGYHSLGGSKRERVGMPPGDERLAGLPSMSGEDLQRVMRQLRAFGAANVSGNGSG